jgi:hypothetical protein
MILFLQIISLNQFIIFSILSIHNSTLIHFKRPHIVSIIANTINLAMNLFILFFLKKKNCNKKII